MTTAKLLRAGILALTIALALAVAPGCGNISSCGGTETGNCGSGAVGSTGSAANPAARILASLCTKLADCHIGLSYSACTAGVSASNNIDTELGVAGGTYATFQDLIDDEALGNLPADPAALSTCIADIQALTCADPLVGDAWDSGAPSDFSDVAPMIPADPGSCPTVY